VNELAVFPDSVALGSTIVAQFKVTGRDGCSQFDGFVDQNLMDMMTSPYIVSVPAPQISGFGCVCSEFMPSSMPLILMYLQIQVFIISTTLFMVM
jgi:hypothetical protein